MIRMTYLELRTSLPALQKLFQQNFTSMKFLLKLRKLLYACEKEINAFEDIRVRLVEQFGEETKDESGNFVKQVKPENQEAFQRELEQVLSTQVELDVEKIDLEELEKASEGVKLELSTVDLRLLDLFFKNV